MAGKPFGLSVKAAVRDADGRILAIRRAQTSRHYAGLWDLPGGKLDLGETLEQALAREVREETGLAVEIESFAGSGFDEMAHVRVVLLFFTARALRTDVKTAPDEHGAFEWVPADRLLTLEWSPQVGSFVKSCVSTTAKE